MFRNLLMNISCKGDKKNTEENMPTLVVSTYLFAPIAVKTLGSLNKSACQLFANLGRKISTPGYDMDGAFLLHRFSVLVKRYRFRTPCQSLNTQTNDLYSILYTCLSAFTLPGNISTKGNNKVIIIIMMNDLYSTM